MMRRNICSMSLLLLMSLLASTVPAQQQKARPISVVRAIRADVNEEIALTGSVIARRVSRISSQLEGFVEEVLVDEGYQLKQGDVILKLDPELAKIAVASATAQVAEARAVLNEARRQRDEAAELVRKKHISATDHEARIAQVLIQEAALSRLKEQLRQQKELLNRQVVYAPFDGVVTQKLTEVGQWVDTSSTLMVMEETKVLRVDVPVPQLYYDKLELGTGVEIRFDAFPGRKFTGEVSMKIPSANPSTRTFPVRIDLANSEGIIASGMSARVVFKLGADREALLVPRDVIVRKPDGSASVWLVQDAAGQSTVVVVPVIIGKSYRDNFVINASDIKAGDRLVIRGNEILQPGQLVDIVNDMGAASR